MALVDRTLSGPLREAAAQYPVVSVTGPRQSGKTTLCRMAFPDLAYVSLEPLDVREFARSDPRGFLKTYLSGAVLDEVQRAPEILGYIQVEVDADSAPGRFVLTGSQHLGLSGAVSQSLAGRTAMFNLLPMSFEELSRFPDPPTELANAVWQGGYPRIEDRNLPPARWLADYVTTYVERDVRQVYGVTDLTTFSTFIRLLAGRAAQEDLGGRRDPQASGSSRSGPENAPLSGIQGRRGRPGRRYGRSLDLGRGQVGHDGGL